MKVSKFINLMNFTHEFLDYKIKNFYVDHLKNIVLITINSNNIPFIIYYNTRTTDRNFAPLNIEIVLDDLLFVQPIDQKNWLLICNYEKNNALIMNNQGEIIKKFYVGEGIQDCQVDKFNNIWISYFDEGIFGDSIIGNNGIVAFDSQGQILFTDYNVLIEKNNVPPIDDCYAMNVNEDEVWLYYYSEFPLVRMKNKKLLGYWPNVNLKENGISNGFAIGKDEVLFGTNNKKLVLYSLSERTMQEIIPFGEQGKKIEFISYIGRGSFLYLQTENDIYFINLLEFKK
ncbi:hypothetical protein ACQYAD_18115 [Neobacillus sp. SM06]|uniref:hypothetical protein n=1 Tax=Neobacillus sp. SM06 TaxID=3422492 RepID=UPI003D2D8B53